MRRRQNLKIDELAKHGCNKSYIIIIKVVKISSIRFKRMLSGFLIEILKWRWEYYLIPMMPNFLRASLIFSTYVWYLTSTSFSRSSSLCLSLSGMSWRINNIGWLKQRTLTYFERGSITVQLTSCLTGFDLAKQVNVLWIKPKQSSWIITSQKGGQLYSDTSPYEVSECSLYNATADTGNQRMLYYLTSWIEEVSLNWVPP